MYVDKEIKGMLRDLIRKKKQAMKMEESSTADLLGLLLQSSDRNEGENNSRIAAGSQLRR